MTLNREELIHPAFYLLFLAAPILGLVFNFLPDLSQNALITCLVFIVLKINISVKLKGNEIIEGVDLFPFGFVKIKKRMLLDDITEIIIYKNEKKYSEIRAISSTDFIIIKTVANRIPAEEKLKEIQTSIASKKEILKNYN